MEHLLSTAAELHREDLLREAEQARLTAGPPKPRALRRRLGEHLIRLGHRLTGDPRPGPRIA